MLATPAYLARAGEPLVPADLAAHETIVHSHLANIWSVTHDGTEASVAVRGRVRLSVAEGLPAAVSASMSLAIASDWMFTDELADGRVRRVLAESALTPIDLWLVFPTGRMASAKAREFAAFVEQIMAQAPSPHG